MAAQLVPRPSSSRPWPSRGGRAGGGDAADPQAPLRLDPPRAVAHELLCLCLPHRHGGGVGTGPSLDERARPLRRARGHLAPAYPSLRAGEQRPLPRRAPHVARGVQADAEAYGKEMRTATQSYEPYGCWLFEQTGNPNSGYVYWREPAGGNGPNCGGLRDCLCLTEVSCALGRARRGFSSRRRGPRPRQHGRARASPRWRASAPAAKAVKYDTTRGKCYSSSATTRPAPPSSRSSAGSAPPALA